MLPPSLALYLARKPLNLRPTIPMRCAASAVLDKAILVQLPERMYKTMRYSGLGEGAKHTPPMICITAYELFNDNCLATFPSAFVIVHVLVGIVDKF
ncbi:hypothetical protein NL676_019780 [Syzygium grande]|nr:hypothetical protein NL676_019780 [Syzygium grande]